MGLKEIKKTFVIDVATSLFLTRSINEVTIKDIADEAEIGEATIYRYFGKKETIILACVMKLQDEVTKKYFNLSLGHNGYEKLKIFYESFLNIFVNNPSYYHFIKEFDAFMCTGSTVSLQEYEKSVDLYKVAFVQAYILGVEDGSVKNINDIDTFYFSTTHALLELCKKLSMKQALLEQDKSINKDKEVEVLVNIILKSLQNL